MAFMCPPALTVRFRIDIAPTCSIGIGKIALLEGIARVGSLSQAARGMRMSYRRDVDSEADREGGGAHESHDISVRWLLDGKSHNLSGSHAKLNVTINNYNNQ